MPKIPTKLPETLEAQAQAGDPLVNETLQAGAGEGVGFASPLPSYEDLQRQLEDSREESRRHQKVIEGLRQQRPSAVGAPKPSPTPLAATQTLPLGEYVGPSQKEIYLALVAGFTSTIDPLKTLNEPATQQLAQSLGGIAEVFHHYAIRRPSFRLKGTEGQQ